MSLKWENSRLAVLERSFTPAIFCTYITVLRCHLWMVPMIFLLHLLSMFAFLPLYNAWTLYNDCACVFVPHLWRFCPPKMPLKSDFWYVFPYLNGPFSRTRFFVVMNWLSRHGFVLQLSHLVRGCAAKPSLIIWTISVSFSDTFSSLVLFLLFPFPGAASGSWSGGGH